MFAPKLSSRARLVAVTALGALICSACGSDPKEPVAEDVYIEVHVTGGIAGADYTYAVDGAAHEARGISCVNLCDFDPGDVLAHLSPAEVRHYSQMLLDGGIIEFDGEDFGNPCCDQFYYTVVFAYGDREATVKGATTTLPAGLAYAVMELDQLVHGIARIIVDFESRPEDWPQDPLWLPGYWLDDDILSLEVEHGGGCAEHEYYLVAWGGWMESFPVQVNVLLAHEDHDDPCDAIIRRTLRFDLTPLKDEYWPVYGSAGPGRNSIILRLTVPDGQGPRYIEYTF
jgi:hypothetical protein